MTSGHFDGTVNFAFGGGPVYQLPGLVASLGYSSHLSFDIDIKISSRILHRIVKLVLVEYVHTLTKYENYD